MQQVIEKVEKEVLEKVVKVRKEKHIVAAKVAKAKHDYIFKKNDFVRVIGSDSVGTIDRMMTFTIHKDAVKTTLDKLELVDKS